MSQVARPLQAVLCFAFFTALFYSNLSNAALVDNAQPCNDAPAGAVLDAFGCPVEFAEVILQESELGYCSSAAWVDSNHSGFTGAGFINTPNSTGQTIIFDVRTTYSGRADLLIRYANGSSARAGEVVVNGVPQGTFLLDSTGAWSSWATETLSVELHAGLNQVQIVAQTSGGLPNVDYLSVNGVSIGGGDCEFDLLNNDSDNDEVIDAWDFCANTNSTMVDEYGCPIEEDSDGDGVVDGVDQCPNTAAGVAVNNIGCDAALDADGDGVNDTADICPNTPFNEAANASGCSASQLDDDSDGVNNAIDQCASTVAGDLIDAVGCPVTYANVTFHEASAGYCSSASWVDSNHGGFTGLGFINTPNSTGQEIVFDVYATLSSSVELTVRFANGSSARAGTVVVNDQNQGVLSLAGTGAWSSWATEVITLALQAGKNKIQIIAESSGGLPNVDFIQINGVGLDGGDCDFTSLTLDSDADGVIDAWDFCPAMAALPINQYGCPLSLDADEDGVNDDLDQCPNTPAGQNVDSAGCSLEQLDSDADGINDALDLCPATPANEIADAVGCSETQKDDDNDGVNNSLDLCVSTPAGEAVNASGCSQSQLDDDGDGLFNSADLCPGTPAGESVDAVGCSQSQLDDDSDGVNNIADLCANTPTGEPVDTSGCAQSQLDDDSDGVFNTVDQCPGTPAGENVDSVGCSQSQLDDDNDGVNNSIDLCTNTPAGEPVDTSGCAQSQLDDDGDGVFNTVDQCPGTPAGEAVNASGCSDSQLDDDSDGVANSEDLCPTTPSGFAVDEFGCSWELADADADGVFNMDDQCDATPAGEVVNVNGCSESQLDDDQDGVSNLNDFCPDTPVDQIVDISGCADSQLDFDNDGVANNKDQCPDTFSQDGMPVTVTSYGCLPWGDEDQDGLLNDMDHCPFSIGLFEVGGCKPLYGDFDGDGVGDDLDQCPYTKARLEPVGIDGCNTSDWDDDDSDLVPNGQDRCQFPTTDSGYGQLEGCTEQQLQDSDGDGVIDGVDFCEFAFGPKYLSGCPFEQGAPNEDIDGDGIYNLDDHCPLSTEPTATQEIGPNGCSLDLNSEDFDQDGVPYGVDQCLLTPLGHAVDDNGCSYSQLAQTLDTDNDGTNDALDQCPQIAGEGLLGCDYTVPFDDNDSDGIADAFDDCPYERGHRLMRGCPSDQVIAARPLEDIDGDFMPLGFDACLYSVEPVDPSELMVDDGGCRGKDYLDYDSDGVINGMDLCPNSQGRKYTDAQGCDDWDKADIDQDGVMNGVDLCPQLSGLPSNNGCPRFPANPEIIMDGDQDGVPNEKDHCPYSLGHTWLDYDERGCSTILDMRDADGDGVENGLDQCADTPTYMFVDATTGCSFNPNEPSFDEDNDGVTDAFDQCPGTPDEPVDASGCPGDDLDHDGVFDQMDECLGSRFGRAMDWNGCEIFTGVSVAGPILAERDTNTPAEIQFYRVDIDHLVAEGEDPLMGPIQFENATIPTNGIYVFEGLDELSVDINASENFVLRPLTVRIMLNDGSFSNWFSVTFPGAGNAADVGSLIVNDPAVLDQTGISLMQAFDLLARNNNTAFGVQLFRQMWDSQRSTFASVFGLPPEFTCQGQFNNFPIVCDRPETNIATWDDFMAQMEMDAYRLTAVVNRLDLRNDWQDCGEHRLVFAKDPLISAGRNFINIEARLPNPIPGEAEGCRSVIEFWSSLPSMPEFEQANAINAAFYGGLPGFMPLVSAEFFEEGLGQIRTTQFDGGEWLFKEHKLAQLCDAGGFICDHWVQTVSVKENPFGPLFDPATTNGPDPILANIATQFQQWFPQNMDGLISSQLADIQNPVLDEFNHGQSHASGPEKIENDYTQQFNWQFGSTFGMDMEMALMGQTNADGSPLMVDQVLARATAMTCAGCHAPVEFGLELPGRIGSLQLPDGTIIDSWPMSNDFVHIDENSNLSPALQNVFLPMRASLFQDVVEELNGGL